MHNRYSGSDPLICVLHVQVMMHIDSIKVKIYFTMSKSILQCSIIILLHQLLNIPLLPSIPKCYKLTSCSITPVIVSIKYYEYCTAKVINCITSYAPRFAGDLSTVMQKYLSMFYYRVMPIYVSPAMIVTSLIKSTNLNIIYEPIPRNEIWK